MCSGVSGVALWPVPIALAPLHAGGGDEKSRDERTEAQQVPGVAQVVGDAEEEGERQHQRTSRRPTPRARDARRSAGRARL